jgi:long-chain acyl-CoA synthetase
MPMTQPKSIASQSAPPIDDSPSPYAARPWLKHYDYWVPPRMTYPGKPLYEILATTAVETPDAQATAFLGASLTFREIKIRTDRLARAFVKLGIIKGDRVGIMLPNCPQYILATFATLRLGAIVVNINPIYTERELLTVAIDSGITALVTLDKLAPLASAVRGKTNLSHVTVETTCHWSRSTRTTWRSCSTPVARRGRRKAQC